MKYLRVDMRLIAFLILVLGNCLPANSSDSLRIYPFRITTGLQGGFLAAHREQMKHLQQGHSIGGFLQLMRPTDGKMDWHSQYNYPEVGLDLFYLHTGNARQMGSQFGLCYAVNLPLIRHHRRQGKFRHWLGLGIGGGYATRVWDLRENHQSDVLGSHLNAALVVSWSARVYALQRTEIRCGLRITHFSNGAYQLPNLGTNNVAIYVAASVAKGKEKSIERRPRSTMEKPMLKGSLAVSGGLQEVPPYTFPKQGTMTVSAWLNYRNSVKHSWTAGADVFRKQALARLLETKNGIPANASDLYQLGVAGGYNLHFNRLQFSIQQGIYLVDAWKDAGFFYHRYGLHYEVSSHWSARLMLKTHFARADHSEWGVAYVF